MQFYFKAQSQHGHSMLQLAVELARIRSFFGDAPYLGASEVATWNVADAPDHLPFALPVGAGFLRRLLPARRSQNRHQKHVCFVGVLARTANVQTALGLCQC